MEGTEVPPHLIYVPVVGAVILVMLIFAFGFRKSTQPPSSMFEGENEKRNRRGKRAKKNSEPKPSTNGHAKVLTDSPREEKQAKGQKVGEGQTPKETAPKISPKNDKLPKNKGGEATAVKEQEVPTKLVSEKNAEGRKGKGKEKDEGDEAWIKVSPVSRKEKKQNKQVNGEPQPPNLANKSSKTSPRGSGDDQKAPQKDKKDAVAKETGGKKKEISQKSKGSPKKIVENQVKASSVQVTQSAQVPESSLDQGKKRKKKGQSVQQETANQSTESAGLTNGIAGGSDPANQKKEAGTDQDGFTPGKSRKGRKKQKTTQEEGAKQTPPTEDKKPKSPPSSPQDSPAKKSGKKTQDKALPSKAKPAAKTEKVPTAEGSPAKKPDGKASSPAKTKKNPKKEEASPSKADAKPSKDKKSGQKVTSSSSEASPAKPKLPAEGSPAKPGKKGGGAKPSPQTKTGDQQPQETQAPTSTSPASDIKAKAKKKQKKVSGPSTPEAVSKLPATPKSEVVRSPEPKADSETNKSSGKKNKRKGGSDSKGKPSEAVHGEVSNSLQPANAKEVSSAKTPDKTGDKKTSNPPTPKPDPVAEVPAVQENENWVEAKPKKVRKKVRRDL